MRGMLSVEVEKNLGTFSIDARFEASGGVTALFGPSGAGKTSIVNMIAGLVTPDRGRIVLDDTVLFDSTARINLPAHRRRIGYVFQEGRLFPHMTVAKNLDYGRWMSASAGRRGRARARHRAAQHRPPAAAPAGASFGRRTPTGGVRPRAADEAAAPAARRAAGGTRPAAQAGNPALSGAAARRGQGADDLCQPPSRRNPAPGLASGADRGRPRHRRRRAGFAGCGSWRTEAPSPATTVEDAVPRSPMPPAIPLLLLFAIAAAVPRCAADCGGRESDLVPQRARHRIGLGKLQADRDHAAVGDRVRHQHHRTEPDHVAGARRVLDEIAGEIVRERRSLRCSAGTVRP